MSGLSEVAVLFGQRAGDIEKAREIFTAETRNFVAAILAGVQRARKDPWVAARVRIDFPREIETESKVGYLNSQQAIARAQLRFKKGTKYTVVADVPFGIEFDHESNGFAWQVKLVPEARYQRIDDLLWRHWRSQIGSEVPPGAVHQDKANTIRFVLRPVGPQLTPETAFNDVKSVLESIFTGEQALGEAVGFDPSPGDEG